MLRASIILCLTGVLQSLCGAQSVYRVGNITLEGNDRTKSHIVLRELEFKKGDLVNASDTSLLFSSSENKIFNTDLFIYSQLETNIRDSVIDINILLKERWYAFPVPIFELADRNFNEWWQQRNKSLDRIEYGMRFYHNNFRGRNERLKLVLQQGFTPKYELFYTIPYINKKLRTGLKFSLSYSQNKQVAFATQNHKLAYVESDNFIRKRFYGGISFIKRQHIYTTHTLDLLYRDNVIGDTIATLNPDFFLNGATEQRYFDIRYTYDRDKRDIQFYPLNGYQLIGEIHKYGIGVFDDINQVNIYAAGSYFKTLKPTVFFAGKLKAKLSTPSQQPYFNIRSLGYQQDFVRGYELFVIDGEHYVYNKLSIKKRFFHKKYKLKIPFAHFNYLPLDMYFKLHNDLGYVGASSPGSQNKTYTNTLLWGYGAGVDITTYYDIVLRLEYSLNRTGAGGFFVHFKAGI